MKGPAELAHGPLLIGFVFNVLLYGIMITQVYLDPLWIKAYVTVLFLADTFNVIFMFVYIYDSLVVHFDDVMYLTTANWVFATDPAMTAIIGSLVQFFFAFRVKVLIQSLIPVIAIVFLSFVAMICGIGTSAAIAFVPHFADFQKFEIPVMLWLFAAAISDVIITVVLVNYLRKSRTGYAATDDKLDRLMKLTVQTGMITSVWAIVDCAVYLGDASGTHLIFNVPLSKLYSNALMSTLNSRGAWGNPASTQRPDTSTGLVMSTPAEFRNMHRDKPRAGGVHGKNLAGRGDDFEGQAGGLPLTTYTSTQSGTDLESSPETPKSGALPHAQNHYGMGMGMEKPIEINIGVGVERDVHRDDV